MKKTTVKMNFAYQLIYEILVLILPLVTSPYIARVIGAEGVGIYSYSHSVAYYFVLFSMLGIKNYGNRAIAQSRDETDRLNKTFSSILTVHVLVSLVCLLAYGGYILIMGDNRLYAIIQTAYVLSALFDISWFYFGMEQFKMTVARSTLIKMATVACIFLFVRGGDDLWKYCVIMALGNLFSQLLLWVPLKKYVRFVKPDREQMLAHVKPLLILFIPAIAISLYKYMDKIMIGSLSSKVQLGLYENAEKVINIPLTVIGAFGAVMLPKMSNLVQNADESQTSRYIHDSMRYVMCLATALTFGMAGVGRVFAPVFWGEEFALSGTIIRGLSVTMPFIAFANVIRTQHLIPREKDREYLSSVIAGAVVNLLINWLLIPKYGAIGATVGTIAAEAVVCIIQTWVVRREMAIVTYLKNTVPFAIIGIVMYFAVYSYGKAHSTSIRTLIAQIVMGVAIYGGASLAYLYRIKEPVLMGMLGRMTRKLGKGK